MRMFICLFLVLSVAAVQAEQLLVPKKGECISVKECREEGGSYVFVAKDGTHRSLSTNDVLGVVAIPVLGNEYTLEEVKSALDKIYELKRKNLIASKNLNLLETDWFTIKRGMTSDVGKKIQYQIAYFRHYKTSDSLNQVMLELEMLKLKYAGNSEAIAEIDQAKKAIRDEYLGIDVDKYIADAKAEKLTLQAFSDLKKVADELMGKTGFPEEKKAVEQALEAARGNVLKTYMPYANRVFSSQKNLDNYVKGKTVLQLLLDDVAETPEQKNKLTEMLDSYESMAKQSLAGVDFSHREFPLYKEELKILETMKGYSSLTESKYVDSCKEQAYLIPQKEPLVALGEGGGVSAALRAVFKTVDLVPKEYGIMVVCVQYKTIAKHYFPQPQLKIINARANIPFRATFESMRNDVFPLRDEDGEYILLYLVSRDVAEGRLDDEGWTVVSQGCRLLWPSA